MLFSIAMALMVVLIAGFWTYQGFFSAAVMFFESLVACFAAFGFSEVAAKPLAEPLGASSAHGLAFGVIFLAVLFGLRFLSDKYFKENLRFNPVVDKAGAGVFGFLTGLVLVGGALITIQMLPIGGEIFGFDRFKTKPDGSLEQSGLLLGPDAFTVKLAGMASSGGLAGGTPLSKVKPDLLLDLYAARDAVQTEDRIDVPENSLKINAYWEARQIDNVREKLEGPNLVRDFETQEVSGGKLLVCDVTVDKSACLKDKTEMYLRVQQFRVVGPNPDSGRSPHEYIAVGMSDLYTHRNHAWASIQSEQETRLVRFSPTTDFYLSGGQTSAAADRGGKDEKAPINGWRFCVAFEVPDDFEPWYIAFKNGARAEFNKQKFKPAPPKGAAMALGTSAVGRTAAVVEKKPKVGPPAGGATHIANVKEADVTNKLPIPLPKKEQVVQRSLAGGKLSECQFFVEVPAGQLPKNQQVTEFDVPEGKKLLLLDADKNQALSMYGRALNYASNVAAQITVTNADGTTYFAQGVYSMGTQGGKKYFEIQYHPEADVPERCLKKPDKVTSAMVKNTPAPDRRFGYIFIVDPGIKIVSFSSGGTGGKQTLNIEVPK
ncbi:MAG TPA: CvpA family protein [Phycisphaerae bacterium]|nr:CvpA family protein [Phycisphaerae bacterium]